MASLFHAHLIRNIAASLEHDASKGGLAPPADLDAFG